MAVQKLRLYKIKLDPQYQPRLKINNGYVREYADLIREGVEFPPIVVTPTENGDFSVISGFHRLKAYNEVGIKEIEAEILQANKFDLLKRAIEDNTKHGVRYTNEDKWQCVTLLLDEPESEKMSDNAIASIAGVSNHLVKKIRSTSQESENNTKASLEKSNSIQTDKEKAPSLKDLNRVLSSKTIDLTRVLEAFKVAHQNKAEIPNEFQETIKDFIVWYQADVEVAS